ncbi:MAG: hypothetical protein SCH71_09895 [Desulfobulbaceae bacterium]|nr:hypothetical protein [Desulfobulbaceae bacterium]
MNILSIPLWLDIVNFGLVVLIWLVQLIIYPAFAYINEDEFANWHRGYVKTISSIASPLMLAQMVLILWLVFTQPGLPDFLMLSGIIIIWISSFSLSVPCHKKLTQIGKNQSVITRLVRTNWIRTILWTAVFLTGIA